MEKQCNKCKCVLDSSHFSKNKAKKDGLNSYCRRCQKAYKDAHYNNNKKYYTDRNAKHREVVKKFILDYKKNRTCERCPENFPQCLHFHHLDPSLKEFNISVGIHERKSLIKIKEEMDKCILLCANCHIKEHNKVA
jgi:hypothetical protein